MTVDIESFITKDLAMGNQLTTDKLKQVNLLEPLPYDIPVEVIPEDLEVRGETNADDSLIQLDDDGQITLTFKKAQIWKLL
jgi:topoisomerase-4 subunit A